MADCTARVLPVTALLFALAGCQLAPPHERPPLPVSGAYPADYLPEGASGPVDVIGWRDFFADPRLTSLLGIALDRNRDLRVAVAQVDEARAFYRIQRSDRLPTIAVGAGATRTRMGAAGSPLTGDIPGAGGESFDRFSVDVGITAFELDFWGRVRNLSEAARADFLATLQGARAFRLSLIRDVAGTYLASLEAAERVALAEATVRTRRDGLRIAERRLEAGVTSALEFRQAETLLTQAETELAALRLEKARNDNFLAVLVGGPVPDVLPPAAPLVAQLHEGTLSAGLPSALLVVRPDVIAAEESLRAARADIGAARAAYFPRISLTGAWGFASTELDELFDGDGRTWNYGASASLPIFDFGRRRGGLEAARARERNALANYERVIQRAFQEVADALAARRYLAEQVAAQERGTRAQRQLAELAEKRYLEGVVGYIEVLDAERNLFAAEQALLQLRRAEVENLVTLYIALGGGTIEGKPAP